MNCENLLHLFLMLKHPTEKIEERIHRSPPSPLTLILSLRGWIICKKDSQNSLKAGILAVKVYEREQIQIKSAKRRNA